MTREPLYMVVRRPKTRFASANLVTHLWFTHATSAADAVRQARQYFPAAFGDERDPEYVRPGAVAVQQGMRFRV